MGRRGNLLSVVVDVVEPKILHPQFRFEFGSRKNPSELDWILIRL